MAFGDEDRFKLHEFELPVDPVTGERKQRRDPLPGGGGLPDPAPPDQSQARRVIEAKQREYTRAAKRYRVLYYTTRLVAGLCSGFLPFVVSGHAALATGLSVVIVIAVVVDSTLDPKGRWQLFSRGSDLLGIAILKADGQYDAYKDALEILVTTESQRLERLVDLETVLKKVSETRKP